MATRAETFWPLLLAAALLWACGDDDGGGNTNDGCPAGHRAAGPACVPVFDDCPGEAEIPVLGGGCRAVGVAACADGFTADGAGGCDPILPAAPCGPAGLGVIGETACQPVGVRDCAAGFEPDGAGGCDPVLPSSTCSADNMAVLGHGSCQPIGECGAAPWGDVVPEADAVFVDASYGGGGSDGSDGAPFTTIGEALAAAPDDGQVLVAAGTYAESLSVARPVRLQGRCASLTAVVSGDATALTLTPGAAGSVVSGLFATGVGSAVLVDGATGVTLERLSVGQTGFEAIRIRGGAEVTLRESQVFEATAYGLLSSGSTVTVERCVVRDGIPLFDQTLGIGVAARCEPGGACGALTIRDSVISGNTDAGVYAAGTETEIHTSVIRDTASTSAAGVWGWGAYAHCDVAENLCHPFTVSQSVVTGNTDVGIGVIGTTALVHACTVRDQRSLPDEQTGGWGLYAQCSFLLPDRCGAVAVTDSLFSDNRETGIGAIGTPLEVSGTIVRNTRSADNGELGRGVACQCFGSQSHCDTALVTDSLLEHNDEAGIVNGGASLTVRRTVIRDSQPQAMDGTAGMGIATVLFPLGAIPGRLELSQTLVEGNRTAGLYVIGTDAVIRASVVRDTTVRLADEDGGLGLVFQCDPDAGLCGRLEIRGSVFERNTKLGVGISTGDATIVDTVVRDTLPDPRDDYGRGIAAWCHPSLGVCGTLALRDSLVEGSHDLAVIITGVESDLSGLLVRDTAPRAYDGRFGRGLEARCSVEADACPPLALSDSRFENSHHIGVMLTGLDVTVSGVSVLSTFPDDEGEWADDFGHGFYVRCDLAVERCGSLEMVGSRVDGSHTAGVAVIGVSGSITSSRFAHVLARPLDDAYGYGILVSDEPGVPQNRVDVEACEVSAASLAGIFYHLTRGTVSRSHVHGGNFSVVMNPGSSPTVAEDNLLSGLAADEPTWINLDPGPSPEPALPSSLF